MQREGDAGHAGTHAHTFTHRRLRGAGRDPREPWAVDAASRGVVLCWGAPLDPARARARCLPLFQTPAPLSPSLTLHAHALSRKVAVPVHESATWDSFLGDVAAKLRLDGVAALYLAAVS